jgi:tetratricopeptide (TPR) repeat protein
MRISLIIVLFLFSCQQRHNLIDKYESLYKNEKYDLIIEEYSRDKNNSSINAEIVNKVGLAHFELEHYIEALQLFEIAIKKEGNNSLFLSNKAHAEIKLGKYYEALNSCEKSLELDSFNYQAIINRSYALIKLKKWNWAMDDLENLLDNYILDNQEKGIAYGNLSTIYLNKSNLVKSKQFADKAISLNKKIHWPHKNKAYIHLINQEVSKSKKEIDIGLNKKPNDGELLYYKGLIEVKEGNTKLGCKTMKKSIELIDVRNKAYSTIKNTFEKYCKE